MTTELYGIGETEQLDETVGDAIDREFSESGFRHFCEWADTVTWPLVVDVYRRMGVSQMADHLASVALEEILERLDEEHADPGGDPTEPTDKMRQAAKEFADTICGEYQSWSCEKTGETITVTREEAMRGYK